MSDRPKEDGKKRAKVTLRIPDDEVSRPRSQEAQPPRSPDDTDVNMAAVAVEPIRPQMDTIVAEEGWSPLHGAPDTAPGAPPSMKTSPQPSPYFPSNSSALGDDQKTDPHMSLLDPGGDIPVDTDPTPALPPIRKKLDSASIEVDMDDGTLDESIGEAPEIGIEDVVSVEPARSVKTPAMPIRPRAPSASGETRISAPPQAAPSASPKVPAAPVSNLQVRAPHVIVPNAGATPIASPLAPPPMTEAALSRKKTKPWWEDLFNDDFIRTMPKVADDAVAAEVEFIEDSLGVEPGAMILDLACGTGRHAIEMTQRGYKVVGFDLSLAMLAKAADEAQDRNQRLNFVQGDMREMTFDETFDGIYSWNTSFGYFEEEKNSLVISKVHKALKKGGQFLLDVVNRDFLARQAPSLAWFEGDGCVCMDEMQVDWITSRMRIKRTMMMEDGRSKEIEYSIRVYSLHELGKMLHESGFRVVEVSGRYETPGVFFGTESPRTIILAEKR